MNRLLAACAITATAVLGLTACSTSATTPSSNGGASASAPAAADQTVAQGCVSLAGPLGKVSGALADAAKSVTDPTSAVDSWTTLTDAFTDAKSSVVNQQVKDVAAAVATDTAAVRDALKTLATDKNAAAVTGLATATKNMQSSYAALSKLCAG